MGSIMDMNVPKDKALGSRNHLRQASLMGPRTRGSNRRTGSGDGAAVIRFIFGGDIDSSPTGSSGHQVPGKAMRLLSQNDASVATQDGEARPPSVPTLAFRRHIQRCVMGGRTGSTAQPGVCVRVLMVRICSWPDAYVDA